MSEARKGFRTAVGLGLLLLTAAPLTAQDWRTTTALRQVGQEDRLEVHLGYGAGQLRVEPADGNTLYRANLRYDAELFEPTMEYEAGVLRLGMEGLRNLNIGNGREADGGRLALSLARGVPLDLDLEFGAAEADIELGGLSVRSLELSTGASETEVLFSQPNPIRMSRAQFEVGAADFEVRGLANANVREVTLDGGVADIRLDFGGEWRGNMELDADLGLGSLALVVPRHVGVRVEKETLLAGFGGARMEKRGDAYYSDNWEGARYRLDVHVEAAFGDINIDWTD